MNATIIFEEKAKVQDQYPLNLNPVKKANNPIQDRNRSIGSLLQISSKQAESKKMLSYLMRKVSIIYYMIPC